MKRKIFEDFVTEMPASKETIEKYRGKLPAELIEAWEQYGFGTFLDGYLKMVNPDEYQELLRRVYYDGANTIPMFVTAFADIITWERDEFIHHLDLKHNIEEYGLIGVGFKDFWDNLESGMIQRMAFNIEGYEAAVKRLGKPGFYECFGYFPLLIMGGSEKVENLEKVDVRVHIDLMAQFMENYDAIVEQVLEATKGMSEEEMKSTYLNFSFLEDDKKK